MEEETSSDLYFSRRAYEAPKRDALDIFRISLQTVVYLSSIRGRQLIEIVKQSEAWEKFEPKMSDEELWKEIKRAQEIISELMDRGNEE